jgi:uncharacterized protein YpuA (DUF1002 family)
MVNDDKLNTEPKSSEQLFNELFESINKQLDVNIKLKEILESVVKASSKKKGLSLTDETADEIKDLVIEAESLQAEERAIFHQLFGTDDA